MKTTLKIGLAVCVVIGLFRLAALLGTYSVHRDPCVTTAGAPCDAFEYAFAQAIARGESERGAAYEAARVASEVMCETQIRQHWVALVRLRVLKRTDLLDRLDLRYGVDQERAAPTTL